MTEQPSFLAKPEYAQPQYTPQQNTQAQHQQTSFMPPPPLPYSYSGIGQYLPPAGGYGTPPPAPKKSRKTPAIDGAVIAGVLLVGGGVTALVIAAHTDTGQKMASAAGVAVVAQRSPFEDVQARCDPAGSGTTIADDGKTFVIDSSGEEDSSGISYESFSCILNAINMPTAVQSHIGDTRALDGRQEDSWEGFTASWSYHPDDGLDMIIRVA
jgi:hypothetical protein